jgi:hypothetical protein
MTFLEARTALALKLDITYSEIANNGLFTDSDLQEYIQTAVQLAWDRHPWDFTEGAKTGTLSTGNITAGYVNYPLDMVTGGANSLVVNGEEFPEANKLQFRDYLKWKRLNPTSTDRYWSEYKRFLFMNMSACAAGQSFDIYGKLRAPTLSADADLLPFSTDIDNEEDSGNEAIVKLGYVEALSSQKLGNPVVGRGHLISDSIKQDAFSILDALWKPMKEYKAQQQSKDRPFFTVPNYFAGRNESRRTNIGNFNN